MKADEIIGQIVSACPWVSREQVLHRLEVEKRKASGFISEEILLRMIAAEFGCLTVTSELAIPSLLFRDLVSGLNDVTITGRVLAVFSPREFKNRSGRLASVLVADRSGVLRVVLWNDKVSLVETGAISAGQIVRFSHGYTRADLGGGVEFHVGERCVVEAEPKDVNAGDYPGVGRFSTAIAEVGRGQRGKRVIIVGMVKRVFASSSFERRDKTEGRVMRFILSDGSGDVSVVVWNDRVEGLEKTLREGDRLQVVCGRVKKALGGGFEVHVDDSAFVGPLMRIDEFLSVSDLREEDRQVDVEGEVVTKPVVREVKTGKGELLKVASFELGDKTGRIWVSLWRKHADVAAGLNVGDRVVIRNGVVKRGFGDRLEVSTWSGTTVEAVNSR